MYTEQQTADDDHDRQYEVDKLLQDDEELLKHSEDENDRSDHQLDIHVSDSDNYEQVHIQWLFIYIASHKSNDFITDDK